MPRPAFLVDGFTEMRALQLVCLGAVLRRLNVNGKSVRMGAIAKAVHLQFRLLSNRCYPVVVLIDREQRDESCDVLKAELQTEMQALGIPLDQFHVGVCDRMIENWIIADSDLLQTRFGRTLDAGEGSNGKAALRQLFDREWPYQETVHGVELLVAASAKRIAARSQSFSDFLRGFPLQCQWLAR